MKTIYGKEGCAKCAQIKKDCESAEEEYEYVDVTTLTDDEMHKLIIKTKQMSLPIVVDEE